MPDRDYLTPIVTDRGLRHLPARPGAYGGDVRVYESSAALEPRLWLTVTPAAGSSAADGVTATADREATVHLDAEVAFQLAEQLLWLLRHHYHGDALDVLGAGRYDHLPDGEDGL